MKTIITLQKINDYGGIIPHTEDLAYGFKKLGHEVQVVQIQHSMGARGVNRGPPRDSVKNLETGHGTGLKFSLATGWYEMPTVAYAPSHLNPLWAADADLVIHSIPVPTVQKATRGHAYWPEFYRVCRAPQIAVIHDGNLKRSYPHITRITKYLRGLVAVHDAAEGSLRGIGLPSQLIPNPHILGYKGNPILDRPRQLFSVQIFKRWKRVDDLVRAVPHLEKRGIHVVLAGDGIERRYMTSVNKCKKEYHDANGNRIWDQAEFAGMEYLGLIRRAEVQRQMQNARIVLDPSWSKNYGKLGAHFNRTFIEAMAAGAVPMATDLGLAGGNEWFQPNKHYIEIDHRLHENPREYAKFIALYMGNTKLLQTFQKRNFHLVKTFDAKNIAKRYLEFMEWVTKGRAVRVQNCPDLVDAGNRKMQHFTGGP